MKARAARAREIARSDGLPELVHNAEQHRIVRFHADLKDQVFPNEFRALRGVTGGKRDQHSLLDFRRLRDNSGGSFEQRG